MSVNKHVSVVGGTWGSLAPNSQFSQVGLCEAAQFLQGIVLRHGELANVGSQEAQRDSLRVWCRVGGCFRCALKAPYHPQQVGCTFGHVWREKMKRVSRTRAGKGVHRGRGIANRKQTGRKQTERGGLPDWARRSLAL